MSNTIIEDKFENLFYKLVKAQTYVLNRYDYYNDEIMPNYELTESRQRTLNSDAIKITIDSIRNKLLVSHFINAKTIEQYFTRNFMNKMIKSCLISGCSFARIIKNESGGFELIPYDAYFATGTLNNDNTLKEAITIDDTDNNGNITQLTVYTDEFIITTFPKSNKDAVKVPNELGVVPIIPIIINQNALKPFGTSYITKKMMSDTRMLKEAKKRADKIQETLAQANTFLLGVSNDFDQELDKKTIELLKNVISITQDANQQTPTVVTRENGGSQVEQKIKDLEESIKYDDTTPSYVDMIEAIREDVIEGINNIGNVMIKFISNDKKGKLNGKIDIVFKNNDFSNFSPFMDGVLKVNQVIPGYLGKKQMDKILGINGNESKLMNSLKNEIKNEIDESGVGD